ncbi:chaperone DnaJ-domain superfamily protein [Striga asiatica]|uniref:Chaperone DnaJ-domain superfamily protein n=1 Tax=Striga asiatica TaxID=4170 RepID=A0A5A7QC12_STRAF|nr:chaperone DnaJ-domain superfamily protein [Striga asiatica]
MESLSRPPPHRRKHSTASSTSSSFSLSSPYDDGLFSGGGKAKFGSHEYAEIFPGSLSSIPVLDLSGLDKWVGSEGSRSSKLDYSTIFGGLRCGEAALPYDELLSGAQNKTKTRIPAHAQSPDRESISRKTKMPSGETKQHFSMSFNKTSPSINGDPSNGENHIAQLHTVPGFTYFIDENPHKAKTEGVRHYSSSLNKSCDSNEIRNGGVHLPPLFDEELDENSVAALSAAALKKAVEQAEESIRIAKMVMERKKERFMDGSLESRSKNCLTKERKTIRVENGAEGLRENGGAIKGGLNKRVDSEIEGQKVEVNAENAGKCEKEFLEHDEVASGEHLKEVNGDLLNKLGSSVEEHLKEFNGDYENGLELKADSPHRKSAEEELGKMEPEISREIGKQVDEVHEVETDEKKPSFGHDGQKICEEYRQDIRIEEKQNSEAQNSKISLDSEETDNTDDEIRDTFKFQVNDEAVDNSGFNETHSNDTMTISSDSREQSDVDSNNEAEEYQPNGSSLGSKTENTGQMKGKEESKENTNGVTSSKEELENVEEQNDADQNSEKNERISKEKKDPKANEGTFQADDRQQRIEAIKRGREREKDRIAVERAIREARERAFAEAREHAEREKAKIRAERAAVERATTEARERALVKARSQKTSSSRSNGLKHSFSSSDLERVDGNSSESAERRKARLERHQRTMERAAKALAEKNMRDFLAQKEQAERNRLAESLDADIKRWVTGKEGNLRALLSTLQYILGPDSGWQSVSLTEIITTAAVKKAYRKATLCVHPDKLQQRGANIHQKYICEKVFDLLKAAWNRFDSEER